MDNTSLISPLKTKAVAYELGPKTTSDDMKNKRCRELLLVCCLVIIAIGCGTLYALMEQNWALKTSARCRVLMVAGFLFISSIALCYYIIKTQQQKRKELNIFESEIICLLVDKPPSYDSLQEAPPPSYHAVISGTFIVPCHKPVG